MVVIARGAAANADFKTLDEALSQLLSTAGILDGTGANANPPGQAKPKEHL